MAFTKIIGAGISETTNVTVGVITASSGVKGIGIFSGGTAIHSGIITSLNFVGSGNTFAVGGANNGVSFRNLNQHVAEMEPKNRRRPTTTHPSSSRSALNGIVPMTMSQYKRKQKL